MIAEEKSAKIFSENTYDTIKSEISTSKKIISDWIENKKIDKKNLKIFGYGASATGTVLCKLLGLDKFLSAIIDDNFLRQNLLSPNSFLPIISLESIVNEENLIIIILAWRFEEQIKKKIREKIGNNVTIISVKPKINQIIEI